MQALQVLAKAIDRVNDTLGRAVAWLALAMVLVQFLVVILRYVFGVGFLWMQESIVYMHATLFMVAAGYTLLHNGHVRVDIFYRSASPRRRAFVNLTGVLLFLLPMCVVLWQVGFPYVSASWAIFEGSKETSGIHAVFLLKTNILLFAGLVFIQGISMAAHAVLVLSGHEAETTEQAPTL